MAANWERLHEVIENRHAYFERGLSRAVEYVRNSIREVFFITTKDVRETLLSNRKVDPMVTKHVVHYTSLQALFMMLNGSAEPIKLPHGTGKNRPTDERFLRVYDSANLNDPSEGAYLMKRFRTEKYNDMRIPAYIASFIRPDKKAKDPVRKARNNLVFWRHYGDDGRGCSISIPVDRFTPNQDGLKLQAVAYGNSAAHKAAVQLRPAVKMLDEMLSKDLDPAIQREVATVIRDGLGEIPYLFKSSAFKYEKECRIVATESTFKGYGDVRHDFERRSGKSGRIRMYGRHPLLTITNILSTGSVITLGPDVANVDYVEYALEQLLRSLDIRDLPIERSEIPYRRT